MAEGLSKKMHEGSPVVSPKEEGPVLRVIEGGKSKKEVKQGFTPVEEKFFESASDVHGPNIITGKETPQELENKFFAQEVDEPLDVDSKAVLGSQKERGDFRQAERGAKEISKFPGRVSGVADFSTAREVNAKATNGMSVEGSFMKRTADMDKASQKASEELDNKLNKSTWSRIKEAFSFGKKKE